MVCRSSAQDPAHLDRRRHGFARGCGLALEKDDIEIVAVADIVMVDLRGAHFGAVRDPIKSLVEYGSASDIDTVIVDGRTLIEGRRALALDEAALLAAVQESGQRTWDGVSNWNWRQATVDELSPMSYPIAE